MSATTLLILAVFLAGTLSLVGALLIEIYRPRPEAIADPGPIAMAGVKDAGSNELRRQLFQAGFDHPDAPRFFTYAKLIGAVIGLALAVIAASFVPQLAALESVNRIGIFLAGAALGYYLPVRIVDRRREAYLRRIALGLPDALDFMLVCVEAGQSTDLAVMRVAEELRPVHPDLAFQFNVLTENLAAGAGRNEAWNRIAQDTGNDDLRQLASIIVQSTTMGTPVGHTLRVFASDLRDRHVRRVEERANVLPTKMTLGTMLFTIPPLLILLLAPAIHRIMQTF